MQEIYLITYRNEETYSNYHETNALPRKLEFNECVMTLVGFKVWSSFEYIAFFSGFNRRMSFNGVKIAKDQIIEAKLIRAGAESIEIMDITNEIKERDY